jgi:prepilin-type N-terminal cleavage/methylation domain-containing protein
MKKRLRFGFSYGFTLIELLVVIAIIGILSAVVLAQLNDARGKGADASIKSNANNMRAQSENLYDAPGSNGYNQVCGNSNIGAMKLAAEGASGTTGVCRSGATYFVFWIRLKSNNSKAWCVDSTGQAKQIAVPGGAINSCP